MQNSEDIEPVLLNATYRILRPLARVAIRYGVSAGAIGELVRRAFVEAAEQELLEQNSRPLSSRICALTGLYRKEVVRLQELPPIGQQAVDDRYNRSARVVTGWTQDPDFCTRAGRPLVLDFDGEPGFQTLVRRYSGDMTPRAMLEELKRLQVVEITRTHRIKLRSRAYVPAASDIDMLQILGTDTAELMSTIMHNITADTEHKRFQRKVAYLHIPERHVAAFRRYAANQSQALLEKLDRWLARHDTEPRELGTKGARLGLGIYLIETDNKPLDSTTDKPNSAFKGRP